MPVMMIGFVYMAGSVGDSGIKVKEFVTGSSSETFIASKTISLAGASDLVRLIAI